jgi:hypothetical protein
MDFFMIFNAVLPWELFLRPPRLETEIGIHESPIPVPTVKTTSPQAGQVGKICCKGKVGSYVGKLR